MSDDAQAVVIKVTQSVGAALDEFHSSVEAFGDGVGSGEAPHGRLWTVPGDLSSTRMFFDAAMPQLVEKILAAGSLPILYAYHGPVRFTFEQRSALQEKYSSVGKRYNIPVLPCAAALNRAIAANPEQNFHNPDRHHLGMLAAFLFSAVLYRAFTGISAAHLTEHTILDGHALFPSLGPPALSKLRMPFVKKTRSAPLPKVPF